MYEDKLCHYGVKGMKWGVRKSKPKKSSGSSLRNAEKDQKQRVKEIKKSLKKPKQKKKVKIKDLSDKDLQAKINRLQMEKRYRDLKKDEVSAGKKLIGDILMTSGKTIGIQVVTYVAGQAINKAMDAEVVNIKSSKKKEAA